LERYPASSDEILSTSHALSALQDEICACIQVSPAELVPFLHKALWEL
jgi:hypothetical protein